MVRRDAVDFGIWTHIPASKLVVPLDTHVIRVGRCLQLTRYVSPGWKMAADITASLRALDPEDPVKYELLAVSHRHGQRVRLRARAGRHGVPVAGGVSAER